MSEVLLGELLSRKGITYGVVKPGDYETNGTPLIKAADVENGRVNTTPNFRISQEKHQEHSRTELDGGELLITLVGTPGQCAIAPPEVKGFNVVRAVGVFSVSALADSRFIMYSIQAPQSQAYIRNVCNTTVQATLNLGDLKGLPLSIPGINAQKAIAHILGTLDDKIELNRKTNETLEAMAKALFKSWFVDFDPVRAKAEGRSTGLPDEISDLFPDSFEDSELGEIPRGWVCSPLADHSIYLSRGISPAYCEEGGVLVLNQKCIRDSRVSFEKTRRHDTKKKQIIGREVRRFDALVNSTGVGTLGRVAMMPICQEALVVDSHVTVVRGGNDQESFFISSTLLNRQTEIEALGEGSTGQTELSRTVLGALPVIFPSSHLISAYFDSAYAIQDKIEKNDQGSVVFVSIRDALLPKLISGEIRIPDAERMLEEVGV